MNEEQKTQYLLHLGSQIRQLRIKKNMSQDELAKKSGYASRSAINKIELGISDVPQLKLKAIADVLGVCVRDLFPYEGSHEEEIIPPSEVTLMKQIEDRYGKAVQQAFDMYLKLDTLDQGELRGEMKQMLKSDKYI